MYYFYIMSPYSPWIQIQVVFVNKLELHVNEVKHLNTYSFVLRVFPLGKTLPLKILFE